MQQSQSTAPFFQQPCQFASPILKKLGENTPHMYSKPTSRSPPLRLPKRQIHPKIHPKKIWGWLLVKTSCVSIRLILWVLGQIHVQFFLGKGCIFCGLPVEADRWPLPSFTVHHRRLQSCMLKGAPNICKYDIKLYIYIYKVWYHHPIFNMTYYK